MYATLAEHIEERRKLGRPFTETEICFLLQRVCAHLRQIHYAAGRGSHLQGKLTPHLVVQTKVGQNTESKDEVEDDQSEWSISLSDDIQMFMPDGWWETYENAPSPYVDVDSLPEEAKVIREQHIQELRRGYAAWDKDIRCIGLMAWEMLTLERVKYQEDGACSHVCERVQLRLSEIQDQDSLQSRLSRLLHIICKLLSQAKYLTAGEARNYFFWVLERD